MHATCGYPAKSTWIKAIGKGNCAGWPLLTVENVHKHYPETDKILMGRLNQTRAYVRSTKPKRVPFARELSSRFEGPCRKEREGCFLQSMGHTGCKKHNLLRPDRRIPSASPVWKPLHHGDGRNRLKLRSRSTDEKQDG